MFNIFNQKQVNYSLFPEPYPAKATPCYQVHASIVKNKLDYLRQTLSEKNIKSIIAVSFKTNYEFATSRFPHQNEMYAETVSEHEYKMAQKSKFVNKNIIINGPFKGNLSQYTSSIIHLDNFAEIKSVRNTKSVIGIRLNTNIVNSRFGFNIENGEAAKALLLLSSKNISIKSLHIHIGSDISDPILYQKTALKIAQFVKQNKLNLEYIDFGGGFPAHGATPYGRKNQPFRDISEYINAISTFFDNINYRPILILEPGRYLIDDAVCFITQVISKKLDQKCELLTVDSTINMLPSLWYRPATINVFDNHFKIKSTTSINVKIFGCSCQEHDVLYQGKLPTVEIGDYIVFYAVGAYNQSMAPEFIFSKPATYFI